MLDHLIRPLINTPLESIAKHLVKLKLTPNHLTILGFISGLISIFLLANNGPIFALLFILCNRLLDGLDGAMARVNQNNLNNNHNPDFGGYLDIVCDFIFYAGAMFAFGYNGYNNNNLDTLLAASFLVFSFIGTTNSFLAYAILAAKNNINTHKRGIKAFYHLGGICEGTETFIVLVLICLIPSWFNIICYTFGILCWITTISRVYCAWNDFT